MVRADVDVRDRLRGDLRDLLDHPPGLGDAALPVGDQHAGRRHDKQADGGELFVAGRAQLLVRVNVRRKLLNSRKVSFVEPAFRGIGGAHDLRARTRACGLRRQQQGRDNDEGGMSHG